ncbi:FAD-dependent monooxygenase [Arthrobacter sp. Br18]|uniref:FAD-dependent monooxygenase n=1 Tax=Arthrobacter sp. Br18 TaxID=1312954 RepID=UPI000479E0C3|nr:FAD-dependent monooxygenase [Arthrobacter sp. Br18]
MTSESAEVPQSTDVLVVGAGPTGLMLANWLQKLGFRVILADGKAGPTRESRALGVQSRSMEIYDQLGVIDTVLDQAQHAERVRPGYGKRSFGEVPVGALGSGLTPYPGIYFLEQSRNERILVRNLERLGGRVLWDSGLVSLEDSADGVRAVLSTPGGARRVEARYCVGCDGGSSIVRKLRGIPFLGITNEYTFYVVDAFSTTGVVGGDVNLRLGETDFLLAFPLKDAVEGRSTHRLIGVLRQAGTADISEHIVRERLARIFGVAYGESEWFSTYRVHHRVAERFRDGAVFLAGDAGHVHSPVGAQGMNTGLQDAHNLALKLADVLAGRAGDAFLDRYDAERRPVAERLINSTDRVFGLVTSHRLPVRLVRRLLPPLFGPVAVRLLPRLPISFRLAGYLGQLRIHYWMSAGAKAAARGRRGRVVGRRLPWTGVNFDVLREAVWQVHTYGAMDDAIVDAVGLSLNLPVHRFPAAQDNGLQAGFFYLVRPDGFVAAEAPAHSAVSVLRGALPAVF